MKKLTPKSIKVFKTLNLYCCFFMVGLNLAVLGPCLVDLQRLINTTTQQIALIYTARSLGYLAGSILGGIVLDLAKSQQIVLTFCNFVSATSMLGIPWSPNLNSLVGIMVVNGIFLGSMDTGCNVMCLTLWGASSGPIYQGMCFTFGLGALVAPLVAAPFLSNNKDFFPFTNDNTTFYNFTADSNSSSEYFILNSSSVSAEISSNMTNLFSIIGGSSLVITLMFLSIAIISPLEKKRSENEKSDNTKSEHCFLFTVIFLNFVLLFFITGAEIGYAQMLTTHVVKGRLHLPTKVGSYMTSAFWSAFTISRFLCVFLAIKLSHFVLILCDLAITLAGSLVLVLLPSYTWAVWLATVLVGTGVASFFPAAVGWLDSYVHITNKIASVFTVGSSFGEMVLPCVISYFIESFPDVFAYSVLFSAVASVLVVLMLHLILRKREKKETEKKEPQIFVTGTSNST